MLRLAIVPVELRHRRRREKVLTGPFAIVHPDDGDPRVGDGPARDLAVGDLSITRNLLQRRQRYAVEDLLEIGESRALLSPQVAFRGLAEVHHLSQSAANGQSLVHMAGYVCDVHCFHVAEKATQRVAGARRIGRSQRVRLEVGGEYRVSRRQQRAHEDSGRDNDQTPNSLRDHYYPSAWFGMAV